MDHSALLGALPKPVAVLSASLDVRYANAAFAMLVGAPSSADHAAVSAAIQGSAPLCASLARATLRLLLSAEERRFRWNLDDDGTRIYDIQVSRFGADAVLVVADQVSDIVEAEEIYAGMRSYFHGVLHSLNRGIIVLDEEFRVTFATEDQR
ncbi:MAG: hypothetical protein ACHQO8_11630, partial [Vicinamibacterales bacterium]